MKTLADLKRDAKSGNMSMVMLEWYGKTGVDIKPILRGIRKVEGANSVALLLRNNEGNTSELRIKYATLIEYDGENLTVYDAGQRSHRGRKEHTCRMGTHRKGIPRKESIS